MVSTKGTQRAILGWLLTGLAAYLLLPWYFLQNETLWRALPRLFEAPDAANGLMHAAAYGRLWLWTGVFGLATAGAAMLLPSGRRQGLLLLAGAGCGLVGLLAGGFLFGKAVSQPGLGWGGFVALLALLMLLGIGVARLGLFRGDVFVACAVTGCSALLVLFVAYPVGKVLLLSLLDEQGHVSVDLLMQRVLTSRIWSLDCIGGGRCGVAWNTLFLALLTAAGTTVLGTMIALIAARGSPRIAKPLNALAVFFTQRRLLGKTSYTTVSGKGDAGLPMPLPDGVRRLCSGIAGPWLAFTLLVYLFAFIGGFVKLWGRDYTITLVHFATAFDLQWGEHGLVMAGTAWHSLLTTIKLAAIAAPLCAGIGLMISWLLARTQFRGQSAFEFAALLAFAIPGTVLGVSYILAFNVPPFELTGTALVIVLCFVFRNLPVGVRAGTAAFKQLDRSLDEASTMLRAGTATTLRRVVLPLLKPALVAALVYSFVRSMTTVSAVIFLVTAENELATTYIIGRVGNGDYGVALAYCTVLIVLMSLATLLIQRLVGDRQLGRRQIPQ